MHLKRGQPLEDSTADLSCNKKSVDFHNTVEKSYILECKSTFTNMHAPWVFYISSDMVCPSKQLCSKYSRSHGIRNEIETVQLCTTGWMQELKQEISNVKMLSAFPNLIGPPLSLMESRWVSFKNKCMTYDMAAGKITKHTGQHVPFSKGSLNNWPSLTRTFLKICPRKGYATRQTRSWPVFHNLPALSPLMILTPFSPFQKWKGFNEAEQSCLCVSVCVCLWLCETQRKRKPVWLCVTAWWGLGLWFLGEVVQSRLY